MSLSRAASVAALLACAIGVAAQPTPDAAASAPARGWALRVPSVDKVVYRGSVNHDAAGMGAGALLYPAPSAIGLLAAIITHGVVNAGMRESQRNEMQAGADQVLLPFAPVLGAFTNRQLLEAGVQRIATASTTRLVAPAEPAGNAWLIETAPVFSMTQDRRALVLDNVIRLYAPGATKPAYAQTVRVVAGPSSEPPPLSLAAPVAASAASDASGGSAPSDDPAMTQWLAQRGQQLTLQSAAMFAESLDAAMEEFARPAGEDKSAHRTFRYAEGGSEKMERAQFVSERCGRVLIRTLRGWLMSIPADSAAAARCGASDAQAAAAPATARAP